LRFFPFFSHVLSLDSSVFVTFYGIIFVEKCKLFVSFWLILVDFFDFYDIRGLYFLVFFASENDDGG